MKTEAQIKAKVKELEELVLFNEKKINDKSISDCDFDRCYDDIQYHSSLLSILSWVLGEKD